MRKAIVLTVLIVALLIGLSYPVLYLLRTGDFPGAHAFFGLQEDAWFVTLLLTLHGLIGMSIQLPPDDDPGWDRLNRALGEYENEQQENVNTCMYWLFRLALVWGISLLCLACIVVYYLVVVKGGFVLPEGF